MMLSVAQNESQKAGSYISESGENTKNHHATHKSIARLEVRDHCSTTKNPISHIIVALMTGTSHHTRLL